MYLLKEAKNIKDVYNNKAVAKYPQTGAKKAAQFNKKVDDLLYYLASLNHKRERKVDALRAEAKKTMKHKNAEMSKPAELPYEDTTAKKEYIVSMYDGIMKDLNEFTAGNVNRNYTSMLAKMNQDGTDLRTKDLETLKKELKDDRDQMQQEEIPVRVNKDIDNNRKVIRNLKVLQYALEASNDAIYGKPSPQFKQMQRMLDQVLAFTDGVSLSYFTRAGEDTLQKNLRGYKASLADLKNAAEEYYLYKMDATKCGEKANKRERTRLDLAKLMMDAADGKDLDKILSNIPGELKKAIDKKESEEKEKGTEKQKEPKVKFIL